VRRVAIIGTPPGLGLRPTLLVSSPRFQAQARTVAEPQRTPEEQPHPHGFRRRSYSLSPLSAHSRAGRPRRPRIRGPLLSQA
jgi:hypothetical protein